MREFNYLTAEKAFADVYLPFPKVFIHGSKYTKLSDAAKIAYMVFKDRTEYSRKNNWIDENGYIYFIFTNEEISELLNKSKPTAIKIKKELEDANLLQQVNMGFNKKLRKQNPNRLYLADLEVSRSDIYELEGKESLLSKNNDKKEEESITTVGKKDLLSMNTVGKNILPLRINNNDKEKVVNNEGKNILPSIQSEGQESLLELYNNTKEFKDIKDIKDIKDHKKYEHNFFKNVFMKSKNNKEANQKLIEALIKNENLKEIYGEQLIRNMKLYSFDSFEAFSLYYNKLLHANREADKETGEMINFYQNNNFKEELSKTFLRVIQMYKTGQVKTSFAGYLFISWKKLFLDFSSK